MGRVLEDAYALCSASAVSTMKCGTLAILQHLLQCCVRGAALQQLQAHRHNLQLACDSTTLVSTAR